MHLAGAGVGDHRWRRSAAYKKSILFWSRQRDHDAGRGSLWVPARTGSALVSRVGRGVLGVTGEMSS